MIIINLILSIFKLVSKIISKNYISINSIFFHSSFQLILYIIFQSWTSKYQITSNCIFRCSSNGLSFNKLWLIAHQSKVGQMKHENTGLEHLTKSNWFPKIQRQLHKLFHFFCTLRDLKLKWNVKDANLKC